MKRLIVPCVLAAVSGPLLWGAAPQASAPASTSVASHSPVAAPTTQPVDPLLQAAMASPTLLQFTELGTSTCDRFAELYVTSSLGPDGKPTETVVSSGTIRVFRADANKDDFTRQGGWYWTCKGVGGKISFGKPGALIMVLREKDGTLRWYAMSPDFRC